MVNQLSRANTLNDVARSELCKLPVIFSVVCTIRNQNRICKFPGFKVTVHADERLVFFCLHYSEPNQLSEYPVKPPLSALSRTKTECADDQELNYPSFGFVSPWLSRPLFAQFGTKTNLANTQ